MTGELYVPVITQIGKSVQWLKEPLDLALEQVEMLRPVSSVGFHVYVPHQLFCGLQIGLAHILGP